MIKSLKNNLLIYTEIILLTVYSLCFILSIYPFYSINIIKNHDFGMYTITQFLFCIIIFILSIPQNKQNKSRELNHPIKYLKSSKSKGHILFIIGIGLILRFISWWAPHYTTDLFRYFSDGLNILQGNSPYETKIIGQNVAYPSYRTIYPLFAQMFLTLGAFFNFDQKEEIYKILFGSIEILFLFWTYKKIIFRKYPHLLESKKILFYFVTLNPLLIFECHVEGHLEIVSIFLFLYAALLLHSRKFLNRTLSAIYAFLSFNMKFHGLLLYPLIFLGNFRLKKPLFWKTKGQPLLWMFFIGFFSLVCVAPFYLQNLNENQSGIQQYFKSWSFNSGLFFLLQFFIEDSRQIIKLLQICICLGGIYMLISWFLGKIRTHQFILRCILIFLFLFPVQHPWYYLLGFYGVLFSPKYRLFWMILMSSVGLSYLDYDESFDKNVYILIAWFPWIWASSLYFIWMHFVPNEQYKVR